MAFSKTQNRPFPVLVATKARARTSALLPMLRAAGDRIDWWAVVEPQDRAAYLPVCGDGRLLVLPENDRGLGYVREWVRQYARRAGMAWYWIIDDDISGFFRTSGGRNVRTPVDEALAAAQRVFASMPRVAVAALEYQQYAWRATRPFVLDGYCDCVVCIHAGRTAGLRYRYDLLRLKIDRDFTLQAVAAGYRTLRVLGVSFSCPENGSNAGGLQEVYAEGIEMANALKMVALWGEDVCKLVIKKDGRPDVSIRWAGARRRAGGAAGL